MRKKLEYNFDDEVASKFCYEMDKNKIAIHFEGYYCLLESQYIDKPCIWIIESFDYAKSKLSSESAYSDLEKHLGIISMVLSSELNDTTLELAVMTTDDRYVNLLFENPLLNLKLK